MPEQTAPARHAARDAGLTRIAAIEALIEAERERDVSYRLPALREELTLAQIEFAAAAARRRKRRRASTA